MKRNTTSPRPDAKAMVTEAWEAVGASFEHFCLTVGVDTLAAHAARHTVRAPLEREAAAA